MNGHRLKAALAGNLDLHVDPKGQQEAIFLVTGKRQIRLDGAFVSSQKWPENRTGR